MFSSAFKIGKKFCFPDAPSGWFCRTVGAIETSVARVRDLRLRKKILYPFPQWDEKNSDDKEEYFIPTKNWQWHNDHVVKDGYSWYLNNGSSLKQFLLTQVPAYPDSLNKTDMVAESTIEKGKPFDIISLLSSCGERQKDHLVRLNGDVVEVESLKGKTILVCCFFVPVFWNCCDARLIRAIPAACSDFESRYLCGKVEVVVVARMRCNWANDEDAFNHFLSGFPSSWLTIPFSDRVRRDYVCKSLDLVSYPKGLLVDSNHRAVLHDSDSVSCAEGTCGFPTFVSEVGVPWWKAHSMLDAILDCKPSDFVSKISPEGGKVSISELKEKLVGLYLCFNGSFIPTLKVIYEECQARNLQFEIVLVYLPYRDSVNPQLFQEAINYVLHNLQLSTMWWVSPFNDVVSRRLWQVLCSCVDDNLIIVGPDFVDPFGKDIIKWFGINAYPFTRECVIKRELEALRALTLESLLVYKSRDYVLRWNGINKFDQVPVAQLRGKIVILYADNMSSPKHYLYDPLFKWFCQANGTTRVPRNFEVVVVDFYGGDVLPCMDKTLLMQWLLCPFDPEHLNFVQKKLVKGRAAILAAFGENGQLISLNAEDVLESNGHEGFSSYDGLRNDVILWIEEVYGTDGTEMTDMYECE